MIWMNGKMKIAIIALLSLGIGFTATTVSGSLRATDLRCEYRENPLGIDATAPRLRWVLEPNSRRARNQSQTAYQVLVAGTQDDLDNERADLWDSGKVESNQSIHVRYAGKPLESRQACFWKVRVWDQAGEPSAWSKPAQWTMGLLQPDDWKAKWIGLEGIRKQSLLTGTHWIWFDEGQPDKSASLGTRYFRRTFVLPENRKVQSARMLITADNEYVLLINGRQMGQGFDFHSANEHDLTSVLKPGTNLLAIAAKNSGDSPNPAGLVGLLCIEFTEGIPLLIPTDATWEASDQAVDEWDKLDRMDPAWRNAKSLGPVGMAPWGEVAAGDNPQLPARMLRREFQAEAKVERAMVYFSGLGLSELYLNGKKVGDAVLSPGLTDYSKRVFYVSYDVTKYLRKGANAIGIILGNGRFFAPRDKVPTATRTYGFPKLLLQLRIDYTDGSATTIISDEAWKVFTEGPIRANNEYDGEDYDARREQDDWDRPGFDDSLWPSVQLVKAPGGILAAQMIEPIRVTQRLKPVALTEPRPGVYVFDMGQNMVGWCRLKVSGPGGTVVTLRHAELLRDDGTLCLDNLRSAKVTDTYTIKGKWREVYEPRFTYHGFRYVELRGYPGKPSLSTLEGQVVNDDVAEAGTFECSQPCSIRFTITSAGVCAAIIAASPPTARNGTSARAGWVTVPSNPRAKRFSSISPACIPNGFKTWPTPKQKPAACRMFARLIGRCTMTTSLGPAAR